MNSNWHPISYRFGLIAAYCSNFAPTWSLWLEISGRRGRPPPIINIIIIKFPRSNQATHLIASVLAKFNATNNLLIDEVRSDPIHLGIMPRSKYLFAEEEPPGCVAFHCSLLLGILLTLRDGVHYVITSRAEGWNLTISSIHRSEKNLKV